MKATKPGCKALRLRVPNQGAAAMRETTSTRVPGGERTAIQTAPPCRPEAVHYSEQRGCRGTKTTCPCANGGRRRDSRGEQRNAHKLETRQLRRGGERERTD